MSPRIRVRMASCWSLLCLVIQRRANRSRVSHGGTKARSLGSDVVHVSVLTISINFNPASLLFLSRESTKNPKKAPSEKGALVERRVDLFLIKPTGNLNDRPLFFVATDLGRSGCTFFLTQQLLRKGCFVRKDVIFGVTIPGT